MTIRFLTAAQSELDEAVIWYGAQAPGLGDAFVVEMLKILRLIEQHPEAWHPVAQNIRRCRLTRFPFSIIYALDHADILVLAIAHMHRSPTYWRDRVSSNT